MVFDVNQANVPVRCENCGTEIPKKTTKLRYRKFLGVNSVNGSLCKKCAVGLVLQLLGIPTNGTMKQKVFDTIYKGKWHFALGGGLGAEYYEVDEYSLENEDEVLQKLVVIIHGNNE